MDIWPDIPLDKVIATPQNVLNQQAKELSKKTKGLLTLKVAAHESDLSINVRIFAPRLNYGVEFVQVTWDSRLSPFPAMLSDLQHKDRLKCDDENQLLLQLQAIAAKPFWVDLFVKLVSLSNSVPQDSFEDMRRIRIEAVELAHKGMRENPRKKD